MNKEKSENKNQINNTEKTISGQNSTKSENIAASILADWHHIIDSLDDIVLIIDIELNVFDINQKGLEVFDLEKKDVIGNKCFKALYGKDDHCSYCPFHQTRRTKETNKIEKYLKRLDGYYSIKSSPIFDNGEIVGFVDVLRDISELHEKEVHLQIKNEENAALNEEYIATIEELRGINFLLNESEQRYRELSDMSFEGILIHDRGIAHIVNKAFLRITGYDEDEIIGYDIIKKLVHHDYIQTVLDNIKKDYTQPYEILLIRKNGMYIPVEIESRNAYMQGKPVRVSAIRDLSDRKETERLLHQSEAFNKSIIESSSDCIKVLDLKGRLLFMSSGGQQLLNIPCIEPYLNQYYADFWSEEYQPIVKSCIKASSEGKKVHFQGYRPAMDDEPKWWDTVFTPIFGEDKEVERILAISRDITNSKTIENELIESERRLKEAQKIAQMGNWLLEIESNKLHWSDEVYRMFDLEPQAFEATYDDFLKYIHPEDKEKVNSAYLNSLETKEDYEIEHRVITKDNKIKYVKEKCRTDFDSNGKPIKSFGVVIDITKSKEYETRIIAQNRELQELNSTKDKFFSIVSHDLRSPISGILGLTEHFVKDYNSLSFTEVYELVGSIYNTSSQLSKLLENLLQWSRINRNMVEYKPMNLAISDFVAETYQLFIYKAKQKKIELINEVPSSIQAYIDNNMTDVIFRNLISNAIKFTPENGTIKVSAEIINDDLVEIRIADTGIGISKEDISKLFRIEHKLSKTATDGEKGSGLGLILCKEFTEKQGGTIRVESQLDKGATFILTFPGVRSSEIQKYEN
jgi:PAS domain S-box-containing protein